MDLQAMKIGYAPCSADMQSPGDRRRFCFYAKKRNIPYEVADLDKAYDLVIIGYGANTDVSRWLRYKKGKTRIVFDMVDSYLAESSTSWKTLGRGIAKFAVRQNRYLIVNYKEALREMCRRADAVICSTEEQRADILKLCPVAHNILDFHSAEAKTVKTNYESKGNFQFVWEGLPGNVCTFEEIRGPLNRAAKEQHGELQIVTDPSFGAYLGGRLGRRDTVEYARPFIDIPFQLHPWNAASVAKTLVDGDLGLIPILLRNPIYRGKPANKLILMWRLGLPVVVSATPAYVRETSAAGLADMACQNDAEWDAALDKYIRDSDARREAGRRGRDRAEREFGEEALAQRWDEALRLVMDMPARQADPVELSAK
jgi:glycosyltransferase involved in cell wall biosynthesis